MGLDFGLRFHVDDGALGVCALLAAGHGDVGALQVVQRQRVGRIVAQVRADLVEREFRRVLELVIAQAECGIEHAREHRQQLLLLLRHDVHAGVLAQNVAQVSQGRHQVSLGAGLVGDGLFLGGLLRGLLQCSAPCNKLCIPILALTPLLGAVHGCHKVINAHLSVQRGRSTFPGDGYYQTVLLDADHPHAGRHLAVIEHQRTQHVAGLQVQLLG